MKTNKKNNEALRHSKRPLHREGGRGGGGHYINDFCFFPSVRTLFNHGSSSISTGTEQIHEYPWVPEVFSRVLRSSAAEMFRIPPFFY